MKDFIDQLIMFGMAAFFIALFAVIFFSLGGAAVELFTTFRKESKQENNNKIQNIKTGLELTEERLRLIKASLERHKNSSAFILKKFDVNLNDLTLQQLDIFLLSLETMLVQEPLEISLELPEDARMILDQIWILITRRDLHRRGFLDFESNGTEK